MMESRTEALECIIIGGGQAGLAASYACKLQGISHVVLEVHRVVGDSWRKRYDSLRLFTPRRLSALEGLAMDGDPNSYPTKDEMADYLERYAKHYDLPIELGEAVASVRYNPDTAAHFTVLTKAQRQWQARALIVATGPFQTPFVPNMVKLSPPSVTQMHSSAYTNPRAVKGDRVLVVGGGNSGAQIAVELVEAGKQVTMALARPLSFLPLTALGKSIFWWAETFGFLYASSKTLRGRFVRKYAGDPIIGLELKRLLDAGRVQQKPAAQNFENEEIVFADSSHAVFDAIIWCTGFRGDFSILRDIPGALNERRLPIQSTGISPVPGLFFMGQNWQRSRASALVCGASRDAEFVVRQVKT